MSLAIRYTRIGQIVTAAILIPIWWMEPPSPLQHVGFMLTGFLLAMGILGILHDTEIRLWEEIGRQKMQSDIIATALTHVVDDHDLHHETYEEIAAVSDEVAEKLEWAEQDPVAHEAMVDDIVPTEYKQEYDP